VEEGTPRHKFFVARGDGETTLFHLSLVDSDAPMGEQFNVSIDVPLVKILVPAVLAYMLLSSRPACKDDARIALQRKGAEKREPRPSRLAIPLPSTGGVGRVAKLSADRQLATSPAGGTVTWMEQRAAWWLTMTGKAGGTFPMRHPTLSVGRRWVLPSCRGCGGW
jgi:hypothetical protein